MKPTDEELWTAAALAIDSAEGLLIGAGAGMGVDSGLPDFRGPEGFWRAYPPYAKLGLRFEQMASPAHFRGDPALGWGFYGHRTNLYRNTSPHDGFAILQRWAGRIPAGSFVFTSNVDDHFGRAGFDRDRILEAHGSIEWWQCLADCGVGVFPAAEGVIAVDPVTFQAERPFPACPRCGVMARPNIAMFGDAGWDSSRTRIQHDRFESWFGPIIGRRLVIVELGAGGAVPTVRRLSETLVGEIGATLIRINPREPEVPAGQVGLAAGALESLRAIDLRIAARA